MARGYQRALFSRVRGVRKPVGRTLVAVLSTLAVLIGLVVGVPSPASATSVAPAMANDKSVPVKVVTGHYQRPKAPANAKPAPVSWPSGSADVTVPVTAAPAATPKSTDPTTRPATPVRAGSLPVWVAPAPSQPTARTNTAAPAPPAASGKVHVSIAPRAATSSVGVNGVLVSVQRADQNTSPGQIAVTVGYGQFASAYGGDWASRLRLVQLPACALTTPKLPACHEQTPVPFTRNAAAGQLTTTLTASGKTATVVAATSSGSGGGGGDYTASTLKPSGSWQAGGSTDAFTWSYPITVPSVPGGLSPQVQLSYDSQAVDGLTSATNNQASWIGDGWNYSPGSIVRSFQSCSQDSSAPTKTGDQCWSPTNTLTMSFNGSSTNLIADGTDANGNPVYRAEDDSDERIQDLSGATNGAQGGEYFDVTTTDGTQYFFGLNQLHGYQSDANDATTNSVWTEPVYSPTSGQPCYQSDFSKSWCQQAYQWNLDYVEDTHGDVVSYFYNTESNYYATDNGSTANASYMRGGYLARIQYGQRDTEVYSTQPAAEVVFTAAGRCDLATCDPSTLSSSTATDWQDVPYDLNCASGAACQSQSPTFWSEYELSTIETEALVGSTETPVDSWSLTHSFPPTGEPPAKSPYTNTTPSLWLDTIQHTGLDTTAGASNSITLPTMTFTPTARANRVDFNNGYPPITRQRMAQVTTETGETIAVSYSAPACGASTPDPSANTALCYPAYWTPAGQTGPILDWFNKYRVTEVTEQDPTGGGGTDTIETDYTPVGAPAWHYNDNPLTPAAQRTWDGWSGYPGMTVTTGTGSDPQTKTVYTYFRGMDGDTTPGGGTAPASVTNSLGESTPDLPQYAGMTYEAVVYNGNAVVTDTITDPWTSAATASQSFTGVPVEQAFMTGTAHTRVYTPLADGSTRETETSNTYDTDGRVTQVNDQGDLSTAKDDICATTSYNDNRSVWILDAPSQIATVSVNCAATPVLPADAVSDTVTYYDYATEQSTMPTIGDPTTVLTAASYTGSTPNFAKTTNVVDEYGRTTSATDPDNRTTYTNYTPSTGAAPTTTDTQDPMGHVTTTVDDPLRALPVKATDAAGFVTTEQYDAIGRLTSVTRPGMTQPSLTYSYTVSNTGPSVVDTNTLNPDGSYRISEILYDAMLRARETQTQTADNGRDITDTVYNTDGWISKTTDPYYNKSPVSTSYVEGQDGFIPSETGFVYDGDGRKTSAISSTGNTVTEVPTWHTTYVYGGDYTTTIPPAGATPTTTITDARGNTTDLIQYHTGVPADPSDSAADYSDTSYTYTPAKKLATVNDAAGNTWSYSYNLLGNQTSATDPDTGTNTSVYDDAGQLISTTGAQGEQITTQYDADGRTTGTFDTTDNVQPSTSDQLAGWTYDSTAIGLGPAKAVGYPTSTTSYNGGDVYTQTVREYLANAEVGDTVETLTGQDAALVPAKGWNVGYGYTTTGFPSNQNDSAIDGLSAENITTGYDKVGEPDSLSTNITSPFVSAVGYTELGQRAQYTFASHPYGMYLNMTYDPQTQALTDVKTTEANQPGGVSTEDDLTYAYSGSGVSAGAGLLTSTADAQNAGATVDSQCYSYDYADRLAQAWTATDACAATPATGNSGTVGGPQPYWQSWTYDAAGDRATQTDHDITGNTTNDTTTTYHYPAPGSATDQPHTLTNTTATGPNAAQDTASFSYDPDGNTKTITSGASGTANQTLTYNDQGQLASDVTTSGNTTYVYDASGNLLARRDPGTTTLFLGDAQLTENTSTGALSGTRYYTIGSDCIASRTNGSNPELLIPDRQGSDQLAIRTSDDTLARQQFLPFGGTRGTPPATWPGGDKGYVGGTPDPATTLENLGAREYDSTTGRFLSADPELDPTSPSQLGGYDYAGNNPTTSSDPTGLHVCGDTCSGDGGGDGEDGELQNPEPRQTVFPSPAATSNQPPVYIKVSPRVAVQGAANALRLQNLYAQEIHVIAPALQNPNDAPANVEGMAWAAICSGDNDICDGVLSETMDLVKSSDDAILINSCAVEGGCGTGSSGIDISADENTSIADHDIPVPLTVVIDTTLSSEDDLAAAARTARNDVMDGASARARSRKAFGGAYNLATGKVAGACSGNGGCAEDNLYKALGSDPENVRFVEAYGYRKNDNKPNEPPELIEIEFCAKCQGNHPLQMFPPGATFDPKGRYGSEGGGGGAEGDDDGIG